MDTVFRSTSGYSREVYSIKYSGKSVELLMLRSLPEGGYWVPIVIQDRQGFSTRQNLHTELCFCPDGHTCKDSPLLTTVTFVGGTIAIILMAFLLPLVSTVLLCWFYVPGSKNKVIVRCQEGEQTLMTYNEESRISISQAKLDTAGHAVLPPVSVEAGKEAIAEDGLYTTHKTFQIRHLDYIIQTVDKTLGQKLYYQNTLQDYGAICEPREHYSSSVSITREDLPVYFLNNLGPTFLALEEIYQK